MWLRERDDPLKRNLPYNFLKCRCIEIRPKMASIPAVEKIQKALEIQQAALHFIFHSMLRKKFSGALL